MDLLIGHGANVDDTNWKHRGSTALMLAAKQDNKEDFIQIEEETNSFFRS